MGYIKAIVKLIMDLKKKKKHVQRNKAKMTKITDFLLEKNASENMASNPLKC